MIVLVPLKGQAIALDRIGDEQGRLLMLRCARKGREQRFGAMPAQPGHQALEPVIVLFAKPGERLAIPPEGGFEFGTPGGSALKSQR